MQSILEGQRAPQNSTGKYIIPSPCYRLQGSEQYNKSRTMHFTTFSVVASIFNLVVANPMLGIFERTNCLGDLCYSSITGANIPCACPGSTCVHNVADGFCV